MSVKNQTRFLEYMYFSILSLILQPCRLCQEKQPGDVMKTGHATISIFCNIRVMLFTYDFTHICCSTSIYQTSFIHARHNFQVPWAYLLCGKHIKYMYRNAIARVLCSCLQIWVWVFPQSFRNCPDLFGNASFSCLEHAPSLFMRLIFGQLQLVRVLHECLAGNRNNVEIQ